MEVKSHTNPTPPTTAADLAADVDTRHLAPQDKANRFAVEGNKTRHLAPQAKENRFPVEGNKSRHLAPQTKENRFNDDEDDDDEDADVDNSVIPARPTGKLDGSMKAGHSGPRDTPS